MSEESTKKKVRVDIEEGLCTATLGSTTIEISPEGNVVVFTNKGVHTKSAAKDFNTVAMYGATLEVAADGSLSVSTNGKVTVKPAAANDTAIPAAQAALNIGDEIRENGAVTAIYAGLTADGKQQIFAMPTDLDVTMTFNDAAKAVKKLNSNKALGHDDWQIPALENVRILQKNQNEGALKGTFSGSVFPFWYWSSTEVRDYSPLPFVHIVRFSDGYEGLGLKDSLRLSCRPVRLVACKAP